LSEVGRSTPPAVIGLLASQLLVARRFGMLGVGTTAGCPAPTPTLRTSRGLHGRVVRPAAPPTKPQWKHCATHRHLMVDKTTSARRSNAPTVLGRLGATALVESERRLLVSLGLRD